MNTNSYRDDLIRRLRDPLVQSVWPLAGEAAEFIDKHCGPSDKADAADAARYRWLLTSNSMAICYWPRGGYHWDSCHSPEDVQRRIDKAMGKQAQRNKPDATKEQP